MSTYVRVTSVIYLLGVRESGGIGGIEDSTIQFFHVLLYPISTALTLKFVYAPST
jgi:hypothetical protein